jgi:hypothetical protein
LTTSGSRSAAEVGANYEEPEERAEAQHQDRGVERQASPLHADVRGAKYVQDCREQQRVEPDKEYVAERGEGVEAEEPVSRVLQVAEGVDAHRCREVPPGAPDGRRRRMACGHCGQYHRGDARRRIAVQTEDLEDRSVRAAHEDHDDRKQDVDEKPDREGTRPSGPERLPSRNPIAGVRAWAHML